MPERGIPMIDYLPRDIEFRILFALDDCLLKMADLLDESFNPKEKDSVALLKTFRATLESRRKWAREYRLATIPVTNAAAKSVTTIPEPRQGQNGTASSRAPLSKDALTKAAIDDVVQSYSKYKSDPLAAANGLLCR
jgi:hypothetical protein